MNTISETKFKHTRIGLIPEEWDTSDLGSVAEIVGGGTPSTSVKEYWNPPEIEWVTAKDISSSQTAKVETTEKRISKLGLENSSAKRLPAQATVMIARGATMGQCRMLSHEMAMNQTCYGIIAKDNVNPVYLYYQLSNLYARFRASAHGSVFDTVITSGLRSIELPLPPYEEQRSIAKVLYDLDTRIELNRRMNKALEAIGKAIFRRWFIDFEFPNDLGRPYKSSGGEMSYNEELGKEMPKIWKVSKIAEVCSSITNGGTPRTMEPTYWNGDIVWFKTGELTDGPLIESEEHITREGLRNSACKLWEINTILIALYASPTVGRLGILKVRGASNQACSGLVARAEIGHPFLFYTLLFKRNEFNNIAVGAAQQNISQDVVKQRTAVIPVGNVLSKFNTIAESLLNKQTQLLFESADLSRLRDELLPKLMSGKIRVPVEVR